MTGKRILGYIFITLATLLTLAIIGQVKMILETILGFFTMFTGKLDSSQIGYIIGYMIYWTFHFVATIALWKYGVRWVKKQDKVNPLIQIGEEDRPTGR